MEYINQQRRLLTIIGIGLTIFVCGRPVSADVVIGDFENGSLDGWTTQGESLSSVAGKGNTLGGSSVGVTLLGQFWGLVSPNLNSHRDDFLKASFLSLDLTFIQADLQGAQFAQTKEIALHDSSGSFVQRQIGTLPAGANDSDSIMPLATAGQWQGKDGTRTIKFDLNSFAGPTGAPETTYKQYLMDHPEITSFDIWISFQSDSLLATYYADNIKLVIPGGTGDFDQNGKTNAADLPVMLSALTDLNVYKANHQNLTDSQLAAIGDFDGDGKVTNADLQKFLGVLAAGTGTGTGSLSAVPEPMSVSLALIGLIAVVPVWRMRRSLPLSRA